MTRFKFRVWDKKLKKFIPWNCFIGFDNDEYIIHQWTGLLDVNKKEIYEDDYVSTTRDHVSILSVDWSEYTAGKITWLREGFEVCQYHRGAARLSTYATCDCCPTGLIVIGNTLENPELDTIYRSPTP